MRPQRTTDTFHHRRLIVAAALLISPIVAAQSRPRVFEVASIRENAIGGPRKANSDSAAPARASSVIGRHGDKWEARNATLRTLIRFAYGSDGDPATPALLDDLLVVGGPSWVDTDAFDIVATMPEDANRALDDSALMLRALLADRFDLKAHSETRVLPAYALVRVRTDGSSGPDLRVASGGCVIRSERVTGQPIPCGVRGAFHGLIANGASMTHLAATLSPILGRTVIDRTRLLGTFDFNLRFTDEPTLDSRFPSIYTALHEQLGLKLESTHAPGTVVVIDSVRRPTAD